jgi:hypothetical protein
LSPTGGTPPIEKPVISRTGSASTFSTGAFVRAESFPIHGRLCARLHLSFQVRECQRLSRRGYTGLRPSFCACSPASIPRFV